MVGIPGQQLQVYYSLESGFVEAALLSPPVTFSAAKKGYYKIIDVGAMVEMPGGGLTTMIKTIQSRPAEVKRVIHALQSAKDEIRKSKPKTVELIVKLLKMDKEAASETYDAFQTTLSPNGVPNRAGIDNLVRSLQAQGRFTDRKVAFTEVADDRFPDRISFGPDDHAAAHRRIIGELGGFDHVHIPLGVVLGAGFDVFGHEG